MGLPIVQLKSDVFTLSDGQIVEYRELSRAEALQCTGTDAKKIETLTISFATRTPLEETEAWLESTPQKDVRELFDAIIELSGLDDNSGKDVGEDSPLESLTDSTISSPNPSE